MKAEDLEGNVAKNYPTPSCQTFDIHIGEWRLEDELGSRLRSRSEDRISIPRILTNSTNNVSFFLIPLIILPIASIIVHHPTLHPLPNFQPFFLSLRKRKRNATDGELSPAPLFARCSSWRKNRQDKKKRERKENRERERERDVVTRGPRQRTGCNSQIYYFSPLVSGAYFTPKRQTGCAARERISQLLRRVFTPAGYISGSLIRTDFTGRLCMRPTVDADQEDNVVEPFPTRINPIDFTRGDRKNPPSRGPLPFLPLLADYC